MRSQSIFSLYAARRRAWLGLRSHTAADLVHEALQAVLIGLKGGREGRHPRPEDLTDLGAFVVYLEKVIKSVAAVACRHENCLDFVSWNGSSDDDENGTGRIELAVALDGDKTVELEDLRRQLFPRLRAQSPRHLRRMITLWERDFPWTDRIPLNGRHRQYRAELRAIAGQNLRELGGWTP